MKPRIIFYLTFALIAVLWISVLVDGRLVSWLLDRRQNPSWPDVTRISDANSDVKGTWAKKLKAPWTDSKVVLYRASGEVVQLDAKSAIYAVWSTKASTNQHKPFDIPVTAFIDPATRKVWAGWVDSGEVETNEYENADNTVSTNYLVHTNLFLLRQYRSCLGCVTLVSRDCTSLNYERSSQFGHWKEHELYAVNDKSGLLAEMRRLDGLEFLGYGRFPGHKSHTLAHSRKNWPLGIMEAAIVNDCASLRAGLTGVTPAVPSTHEYNQPTLLPLPEPVPVPTARTLDEFMRPPANDPGELLKHRYLCRGGGLLLVGQTGLGKSSLAMQLMIKWALGQPIFGFEPTRSIRSLIIQAENDDGDLAEMKESVFNGLNLTDEERATKETDNKGQEQESEPSIQDPINNVYLADPELHDYLCSLMNKSRGFNLKDTTITTIGPVENGI